MVRAKLQEASRLDACLCMRWCRDKLGSFCGCVYVLQVLGLQSGAWSCATDARLGGPRVHLTLPHQAQHGAHFSMPCWSVMID